MGLLFSFSHPFALRVLFGLCFVASHCFAELGWETTEVRQTVGLDVARAEAVFAFKNSGTESIEILDVKTSCGCTTARLKKRVYKPGESGQITAVLDIGDRRGLQKKIIRVYYSSAEEPQLLTMATTIPEVLAITPRFVFWKSDQSADEKIVDLKVGLDRSVQIVSAEPSSEQFVVTLETLKPGWHYRLRVKPAGLGKVRGVITIKTDTPEASPKSYRVFAHVR